MHEQFGHIVNRFSHLVLVLGLLALLPKSAAADNVVLVHPSLKEADPTGQHDVLLDELSKQFEETIKALGHTPMSEAHSATGPLPETANEMVAIAEIQGAQWVVAPILSPSEQAVWLTLKVASVEGPRLEEIDSEVRDSRRAVRLKELLGAMLRPSGLGESADQLAGEDQAAREAEEAAEAKRIASEEEIAHREELQRLQDEEQKNKEQEQAIQPIVEPPPSPDLADAPQAKRWMIQVGGAVRPLLRSFAPGTLGAVELRFERSFDRIPQLRLRGGVDVVFGSAKAIAVHAGVAYFYSPHGLPLDFGGAVEVGMFQALSGNRVPSFSVRVAPTIAWNVSPKFSLEAAIAEIGVLSANDVVITLGFSLRGGFRF